MNKNKVTFWGVRGSNPTPDSDKIEYGGHTSCVSIHTENNELLIIDMGTGIRNLSQHILNDPDAPKTIHIILSHYHWDHIIGALAFAPLFLSDFKIHFYGKKDQMDLKEIFNHMLHPIFWPASMKDFKANLNFHEIDEKEFNVYEQVKVKPQIHGHPNGALSFRISIEEKVLTYITDCEHPDNHLNENLIELANNSDILIHDAHFTPKDLLDHKGWGHSSWKQATEMAQKTQSKKLVLFHHNPFYNDNQLRGIELEAQSYFKETISAKQNLVISL
tara:strand:- start:312 stop:1136 length:825 start_codon:yes stop_codon:yes gene_type:complete